MTLPRARPSFANLHGKAQARSTLRVSVERGVNLSQHVRVTILSLSRIPHRWGWMHLYFVMQVLICFEQCVSR